MFVLENSENAEFVHIGVTCQLSQLTAEIKICYWQKSQLLRNS